MDEVLGRAPLGVEEGLAGAAWALSSSEALRIAEHQMSGRITPEEIRGWAVRYPEDAFWWSLEAD